MGSKNITKRAVDALRCPPKADRVFLWDDKLSGFGVCAYPPRDATRPETARKVYVAQFRQHGRSRRMKLGEHGRITPDQARSAAKKVLGAVEHGKDPIEERRVERGLRSLREVSEEFMRLHVDAKRKTRTEGEYRALLDAHILPTLGSRALIDVKTVDASRLHAKLSHTPATANRVLAVISSMWNWAAKRGEVPMGRNPAQGLERYRERSRERYLSSAELGKLGDALRLAETTGLPWVIDEKGRNAKHLRKGGRATKLDPHAIAAIRLLILTGARLREVLDAKWEHVDWERGLLHVPESKTGKKTIYLSAPTLTLLQALPRLGKNPYVIPGSGPRKTEKKSKGITYAPRADLKKPWSAISRAAGLEGVRLHDLRHSFAATGASASLGLPMIGKLLGHSQPATTARYAHLDADPMRRAANIIGEQIAAAMGGAAATLLELPTRSRRH